MTVTQIFKTWCVCFSHSVMSDSLQPHGLWPARLLSPWNFPGKDTGVDFHFLLQGIFLTQGSNLGLLHCRRMLYHLSYKGSPWGSCYSLPCLLFLLLCQDVSVTKSRRFFYNFSTINPLIFYHLVPSSGTNCLTLTPLI